MVKVSDREWRYLVRALGPDYNAFPQEMKALDRCEVLGTATVDTGKPNRREPWTYCYSAHHAPTISMWEKRGFEVALLRREGTTGKWQARVGEGWCAVEFSTIITPPRKGG